MSGDRRGVVALQFALLAIPYLVLTLGLGEIGIDLFTQEALDLALQAGARKMATGAAANATGEADFVSAAICNTGAGRLLVCDNIHVKVQIIQLDRTAFTSARDFASADVSTGSLPLDGNVLNLSSYDGSKGNSVFCTAPPGSLILVSAIYVGPTFLSAMLPGYFSEYYQGSAVHAVLSQVGVASEQFDASPAPGAAPQC